MEHQERDSCCGEVAHRSSSDEVGSGVANEDPFLSSAVRVVFLMLVIILGLDAQDIDGSFATLVMLMFPA